MSRPINDWHKLVFTAWLILFTIAVLGMLVDDSAAPSLGEMIMEVISG